MAWYGGTSSGWDTRTKFTVDHTLVSGTPTNIPILVAFTGLTSATVDDLRVTGADGTTEWPIEVISCSGAGTGILWTKAPSLSSSVDTDFYVYYNNSGASAYAAGDTYGRNAVWTSFEAVYHLGEEASGTGTTDLHLDSAGGDDDADDYASATGVSGKVGDGREYDGTDDYILMPSTNFQDGTDQTFGTILAWVNPDTATGSHTVFSHSANTGTNYTFAVQVSDIYTSTFQLRMFQRLTTVRRDIKGTTTTISSGAWTHIAASVDNSGARMQVNGTAQSIYTASGSSANNDWLGDAGTNSTVTTSGAFRYNGAYTNYFNGHVDELWISKGGALSADYISTLYQNQNAPGTFMAQGSEESNCFISITNITPSACSGGSHDVDVTVSYTDPPSTGTLNINIDGGDQYFAITSSPQTVTYNLGLTCDGSSNTVTASFTDGGCSDSDTYTAPISCTMLINSITPTSCAGGTNCEYDVDVQFSFTNDPGTGTVVIDIDGDTYNYSIGTSPQTETITRTCGVGAGNVEVYFSDAPTCTDSDTFAVPSPLSCSLAITGITPGSCSGSTYSVDVTVAYSNAPCTGQIELILDGVDSYFYAITSSPQVLTVPGRSCGEGSITVDAEFTADPLCSDSSSYSAPAVTCTLNIESATPGPCSSLTYDLTLEVTYLGGSGDIQVNVGASAPQTFAQTSSPQTVVVTGLPCDTGTTNVTAFFTGDVGCLDTTSFLAPYSDPAGDRFRVTIDGDDYTDFTDLGDFTIDLVNKDAEIWYEYPGRITFTCDAYDYLRSEYETNPCSRPVMLIATKCLGDFNFEDLISMEIVLSSAEWDLCRKKVTAELEDVSGSARLRNQKGDKVCITPGRTLTGLQEPENRCDYGTEVDGMLLFDLLQEVADATLGAAVVNVSSTILTNDYVPERWQIDFPTLAGASAPFIYADVTSAAGNHEMRASGYTLGWESNETSLRRLWKAFHYKSNTYPKQDDLLLPWLEYDPETNDSRIFLNAHFPLTVTVGPSGTSKTKVSTWEPGFGNLAVCANLSDDTICTSWGDLVDLLKRLGLGVYYNGDQIEIEPFANFFQAGGTANTPVSLSGDHYATESTEKEWLIESVLIGEDSPLSWRNEFESAQNWNGCSTNSGYDAPWSFDRNISSNEVSGPPIEVFKPGNYTFGGSLSFDASATSITVTFDVEIFVNGVSVYTVSTGESIPAGTSSYPVSVSPFSLSLNNGYYFEVRLTNVNDVAEAALLVDDSSTFGATVSNYCPAAPEVYETRHDATENPFNSATNSCKGEIKDFRIARDFHAGHGRLVGEAFGKSETANAKYLFFIDRATDEIIRYTRPFYFSTNTSPSSSPPCSIGNLDDEWNGFSFYNAHLSRWAFFYLVAYGHRLNLSKTITRYTSSVANVGGGRFSTFTSTPTYYTFAFDPFAALGVAPFRRLKFETKLTTDEFVDIVTDKRITATLCGTSETGEVGRLSWKLLTGEASVELLAN